MSRALLLTMAMAALAGCQPQVAPVVPAPRYVVGEPYQAGGVWRYPREQFAAIETGLAVVATRPAGLTANGEVFDKDAPAAAHRTLQLPAVARITDLETGRAVLVRINDRGPAAPGRLVAVTRRTAELLGATGAAPFQVRVQVLETESRQLAGAMAEVTPLQVATAPVGTVQAESLTPGAGQDPAPPGFAPPVASASPPAVPLRLPEQVWQGPPAPGMLYVECGSFARPQYARLMQQRLAGLGARVSTDYAAPRDAAFRVRIGPLADVAEADAALDRALRAGVSDARIVVDDQ